MEPRTLRLIKLTLAYLSAIIAAVIVAAGIVYAIWMYLTPWALLGLLIIALLTIPAYHEANLKLKQLEERERRVERELRRSN